MTVRERAAANLAATGVDPGIIPQLARYCELVLAANAHFNLTGAAGVREFVPHVIDSLSVLPYLAAPFVDVGSGAGLPGVPAAIGAGLAGTLVESSAKKAAFLRDAVAALGLPLEVVHARAEEAARRPDLRDHFASGTVRAVAAGPAALELLAPFLAVGGLAVLQRGAPERNERDALAGAALMLASRVEREVAVPDDCRLVLVRKIGATPERFPRRTGIPAKRPLCGTA